MDFDRPETLASALDGIERMLLISTDNLAVPGARIVQHRNAIAAADRAGIQHVVYTSVPSPHPTDESSIPNDHFWTELALFASGMDWTVLRNAVYSDVLPLFVENAVATGQLLSATGERRRAYVTRADCARVAAFALLNETGKRVYDVTGPEAVSHRDIAEALTRLYGTTVSHSSRSRADMELVYLGSGMPPFLAKALAESDEDTARGLHGIVSSTVQRLTGRGATTVAAFLDMQMKDSIGSQPPEPNTKARPALAEL